MGYGIIATWKMAYDGICAGDKILKNGGDISQAIVDAVTTVEDNPNYTTVGFGGFPNCFGEVELDASYMDGDTLKFGAVISVKNIKNPIKVAKHLSNFDKNNVLAAGGAESFAQINGYEFSNMLSENARQAWLEKRAEKSFPEYLEKLEGHDTVCVIGKDKKGSMASGVSTSGLFMKHPGRVGDSPVIGSGFYCDSEVGGAAATGLGEDIMRGCLSFRIVMLVKGGMVCQSACETALAEHIASLERRGQKFGDISVIAMDNRGNFGGATNRADFPFIISNDDHGPKIMVAQNVEGKINIAEASESWLNAYKGD